MNENEQGFARGRTPVSWSGAVLAPVRIVMVAIAWILGCSALQATDRFFPNQEAVSPDGRLKVVALSPENKGKGEAAAFASDFVYQLTEAGTGKVLWTRKQKEDEGSCADLHLSDEGRVVVFTGWNKLVLLSPEGRTTGTIDLLEKAFTKKERKEYVSDTTAGPMWSGLSLWYFATLNQKPAFVIRPWWGRRVLVDLTSAGFIRETKEITGTLAALEGKRVLMDLEHAVENRKSWDREDCCDGAFPVLRASFLAGCLYVEGAVPFLEELQDSEFSGSSTTGGLGALETFEGEVNPHDYSTFTLRQVIRFSLRRLGRTPKFLPCHEFEVCHKDSKKDHPYVPKAKSAPDAKTAESIKAGMKAEEVLDLIGSPDWVGYDSWEYDLDTSPSMTLKVKWDARKVTGVERIRPAVWKRGLAREAAIAQ